MTWPKLYASILTLHTQSTRSGLTRSKNIFSLCKLHVWEWWDDDKSAPINIWIARRIYPRSPMNHSMNSTFVVAGKLLSVNLTRLVCFVCVCVWEQRMIMPLLGLSFDSHTNALLRHYALYSAYLGIQRLPWAPQYTSTSCSRSGMYDKIIHHHPMFHQEDLYFLIRISHAGVSRVSKTAPPIACIAWE